MNTLGGTESEFQAPYVSNFTIYVAYCSHTMTMYFLVESLLGVFLLNHFGKND